MSGAAQSHDVPPRGAAGAGSGGPAPEAGRAPAATGLSAVLFATTATTGGGAASALPLGDTTVLRRLLDQLAALRVRRAWVITRPQWRAEVERAASGAHAAPEVTVIGSEDVAEDLRAVARLATDARGPVLIARGDAVTQREALAGLLADPRVVSGILVSASSARAGWSFPTRSARGRVVSAGSAYHRVSEPGPFFLGVLKVDARDRPALASSALRLAELCDARPSRWEDGLERNVDEWRSRLWMAERADDPPPRPSPEAWASLPLEPGSEEQLGLRTSAAREDAVPLLLVGLVRSDVALTSRHLRGFHYARPVDAGTAAAAERELGSQDEDRIALDAAVKGSDGFFTTFFVSPYSRYLARFAARRGWTPNAITTLSMVIGTVAAVAFATGSRAGLIAGAILLQVAFTADCVDGQLARYSRQFSKLGAWLDSVFDRGKEYVVYAGLAIGSQRGFGEDVWTLAAAALTLQTVRHLVDFSYAAAQRQVIASAEQRPLEDPDDVPPVAGPAAAAGARPAPRRQAAARPPARASLRARVVTAGRGGLRLIGRLDRWSFTRWGKRILVLPIGERFAVISLTAAIATPRVTFIVLLAWGGLAAAYAVLGRTLRSVAR